MVQQDSGSSQPGTGGSEQSKPAEVAGTASGEVSNVVSTAGGGAKEAVEEASTQVKVVAGQARRQLDDLVTQTRDEVRSQAESRNTQAAQGLRTLSQEVSALAAGRPDDAGPLPGLLEDAQRRVDGIAERLEGGGTQGVIDDVSRFARRRPGLFLAGAIGAGFLVGRLVRAGAAHGDDGHAELQSQRFDDPMSPMGDDQFPTTDPLFADGSATLPPPGGTTTVPPSVLPMDDDPTRGTSS